MMASLITFKSVFVILLGCLLIDVGGSFRLNPSLKHGTCDQVSRKAAALEKATVTLHSGDSIFGKWVSEECETRPGPEFLLRSYTFHPNNTFKLVQHYYGDDSCSSPVYTVVARGKLRPPHIYSLFKVSIIAHNPEVAGQLAMKMNMTCTGRVKKRLWKPMKEYLILNLPENSSENAQRFFASSFGEHNGHKIKSYATRRIPKSHLESFNCLPALSLVFHELQHYKIRIRPAVDSDMRVTHFRQELLLGDIHSRLESRAFYKPTSYQVPLLKIDSSISETLGIESSMFMKGESLLNIDAKSIMRIGGHARQKIYLGNFDFARIEDLDAIKSEDESESDKRLEGKSNAEPNILHICHVCALIASANEKNPPYLGVKVSLPLRLGGEWVSLNCESRPMGLYLTRHFRFYTGDDTWIVEYKFYSDTVCSSSSFSVTAAGHYNIGGSEVYVSGGTEVDFHLERASLTVFDPHMMENLEHDMECGIGSWKLGVPREMSSTRGCKTLGLIVPNIEYELLKMGMDSHGSFMLYMGQADTDNKRRGLKDRPTAYQLPLVQCQDLPPHSESLKEILNSPLYNDEEYSNIYDSRILAMDLADNSAHVKTVNSLVLVFYLAFYWYRNNL